MKILAVLPAYPPHSLVGSWITTAECLSHMAKRGHDVEVHAGAYAKDSYEHDGVRVHGRAWASDEDYAAADLIVSHLGDNQRAAKTAARVGTPMVRMVHGADPYGANTLVLHGPPALAVFPSQAAADAYGYTGPHIVVHPPLDPASYKVERTGTEVVLVNLTPDKGGHLFWKLAETLPHLPFLGVRGGYGEQTYYRRRNVALMDPQIDMRRVYRRTRVLLMPSLTETYGRVGVEAAVSGIPIVAHPSPGLREALGDAPMWVDRDDLEGWSEAVRFLALPAARQAAVSRSEALAAALDRQSELDHFATALEALRGGS